MRALCEGTNNRVGEREHEIVDELKPLPNERVFNKITPSAFTSTPIELVLRTYGVDTLLFTGVSTNMCVEHTMRDAASYGFYCFLVEDACGADSPEMHDAARHGGPAPLRRSCLDRRGDRPHGGEARGEAWSPALLRVHASLAGRRARQSPAAPRESDAWRLS